MNKVYRIRMEPNQEQRQALERFAGARRYVWNWGLARTREHYAATGKHLSCFTLTAELTQFKKRPENAWMHECYADSLNNALRDLDAAYQRFFKAVKAKNKDVNPPQFKSKKNDRARFRMSQGVFIKNGMVRIPKIGLVRLSEDRTVLEKTKSATFRKTPLGHWYVSLVVEFDVPDVEVPYRASHVVGIDVGLIDFVKASDGFGIAAPKFYRKMQRRLRLADKKVSRRTKGSARHQKAKLMVSKLHQKIANQRSDFLHKLSTYLIENYDRVCIEDLSLKGLVKTKLAKSFMDAALGEFRRQLEYKGEWARKPVVVIDRFFPSSKMCNQCKTVNKELTLQSTPGKDREWVCSCGAVNSRDLNAARNILDEGMKILAVRQTDRLNAQGEDVSQTSGSNIPQGSNPRRTEKSQPRKSIARKATQPSG